MIHPTLSEAINDINGKTGQNEQDEKDQKLNAKHIPARVSHRQINVHGVPQGVAPNVSIL